MPTTYGTCCLCNQTINHHTEESPATTTTDPVYASPSHHRDQHYQQLLASLSPVPGLDEHEYVLNSPAHARLTAEQTQQHIDNATLQATYFTMPTERITNADSRPHCIRDVASQALEQYQQRNIASPSIQHALRSVARCHEHSPNFAKVVVTLLNHGGIERFGQQLASNAPRYVNPHGRNVIVAEQAFALFANGLLAHYRCLASAAEQRKPSQQATCSPANVPPANQSWFGPWHASGVWSTTETAIKIPCYLLPYSLLTTVAAPVYMGWRKLKNHWHGEGYQVNPEIPNTASTPMFMNPMFTPAAEPSLYEQPVTDYEQPVAAYAAITLNDPMQWFSLPNDQQHPSGIDCRWLACEQDEQLRPVFRYRTTEGLRQHLNIAFLLFPTQAMNSVQTLWMFQRAKAIAICDVVIAAVMIGGALSLLGNSSAPTAPALGQPCSTDFVTLNSQFSTLMTILNITGYRLTQSVQNILIALPNASTIPLDTPTSFITEVIEPRLVAYGQTQGFTNLTTATDLADLDPTIETALQAMIDVGSVASCASVLTDLSHYVRNIMSRLDLLSAIRSTLSTLVTATTTASTTTVSLTDVATTTAAVTATLSASPTSLVTGIPTSAPGVAGTITTERPRDTVGPG